MFNTFRRLWSTSFPLFPILILAFLTSIYFLKGLWYHVLISVALAFFGVVVLVFGIVAFWYHFRNRWKEYCCLSVKH
jgi:hypothetical protein